MPLPDDLTTLDNLQTYIGASARPPSDEQLIGMISRVSGMIHAYLARPSLLSQSYTRLLDGTGTPRLMLPDWPITGIASVVVGHRTYIQAPNPGPIGVTTPAPPYWGNYRFRAWDGNPPGQPATVELLGPDIFTRGQNNVLLTYAAGYLTSEAWTVPGGQGPYEINLLQPRGIFAADGGLVYANGTALTAMPAGSTLAAGQYIAPTALQSPPVYTFASGDAGLPVIVSYSFVPAALEQACLDAIAALYYPLIYGAPASVSTLRAGQSEIQFSALGTGPGKSLCFISPFVTMSLQPFKKVTQ